MKKWLIIFICLATLFCLPGCGGGAGGGTDENTVPVAFAGDNQNVKTGTLVTLSGSGTDADGDLLSYRWAFVSKPANSSAALSSQDKSNPSFTVDLDGTYILGLVVNDGTIDSQTDTVTVTATPVSQNSAPVANAGPDQNVTTGTLVTLSGSGTDADGDLLSYRWAFVSKPANSSAALSSQDKSNPSFTVDLDGTYILGLVVNDGTIDSQTDTVTVTATPVSQNSAPVANAGPDQNVTTGTLVTLSGSGTDADGDLLSYRWAFVSKPANSSAALSSQDKSNPSFTVDLDGTYILGLVVNDGTIDSQTDTVTVTATPVSQNSAPVANAGPDQNVTTGTLVTLSGSGTDADGDLLSYRWAFVSKPANSSAALSSQDKSNPSFTVDLDGTYILGLVVNDGTIDSQTDTVTVTATPVSQNSAPVANAGPDQNVTTGTLVTLSGSGTDADGDLLSYRWAFVSKPANSSAALSSQDKSNPSFTVDLDGTYILGLVVNDGTIDSQTDTVTVTSQQTFSETIQVSPIVETTPVPDSGDAADDPCIWVHPADPSQSVIIGTNKLGGIAVYNLNGTQIQYIAAGDMNNVDIRYGFSFGGVPVDLVGMSNRSNNTLVFYKMDPNTRQLSNIGSVSTNITVYGFCLYKSADGTVYAFVNSATGAVRQYEIFDNNGTIAGALRRSFSVGSIVEGCVADDETGYFYIAEETVGIWKYGAEPGDGTTRTSVDTVFGNLTADIEGLTIYYGTNGQGYLIASAQGASEYVIYSRVNGNYLGTFEIIAGNGIDGVSGTDGIDVISTPLGSVFPFGVFVAQDNDNSGSNQNFKLVRWQDIALGFTVDLSLETSWNPRGNP